MRWCHRPLTTSLAPAAQDGSAPGRLLAVLGQLIAEEIYQQPIMEAAVAAALVLAHNSDGPEA
jgi:hypothetical protein